jgi:UDP-N-acetylglucosamine--N-acetylmuramyl-(pentapeptide) pyrophosphoryl-undecaprenol N-acetylglucosamine transferase
MSTRQKYLFAASTGGHLAQLARLAPRFNPHPDSLWLTFRTPQSESLLKGKRVQYVPYIAPRDFAGAAKAALTVRRIVHNERFDRAVSTGAAIAVSVLPIAKLAGVRTTYIESVSRVQGPSLSGRMIAALHAAELYTQHESWATGSWQPYDGVLAAFEPVERTPVQKPRLFVTLGTIEGYRFDSLVDGLLRSGLADERTEWQLGHTTRDDLPGNALHQMSSERFQSNLRNADVVVTHAGVGTILQLLEEGVYPVVVPRDKKRNEHVDNHQYQIADLVEKLGIGMVLTPDRITAPALIRASGMGIKALVNDESRSR